MQVTINGEYTEEFRGYVVSLLDKGYGQSYVIKSLNSSGIRPARARHFTKAILSFITNPANKTKTKPVLTKATTVADILAMPDSQDIFTLLSKRAAYQRQATSLTSLLAVNTKQLKKANIEF